jgi:hypothetical protein
MSMRLPKRFSIRAMLVIVAVIALTVFVIRDHLLLSAARRRFKAAEFRWQAGQSTNDDYITASEALMSAETEALWISQNAALGGHALRLLRLYELSDLPSLEDDTKRKQDMRDLIHKSAERLLNR